MAAPTIPHLKFPLELDPDGTFAVVEQDLIDDVRQCVFIAKRTQLGSRPASPTSGVEDPTFTTVDPEVLQATLEAQEPRASVTVTVVDLENGEVDVDIDVALAAEVA